MAKDWYEEERKNIDKENTSDNNKERSKKSVNEIDSNFSCAGIKCDNHDPPIQTKKNLFLNACECPVCHVLYPGYKE